MWLDNCLSNKLLYGFLQENSSTAHKAERRCVEESNPGFRWYLTACF